MNIVSNELTKKFIQEKYPMSTGSEEWWDIKTDFELEDDAIMGTVSYEDYNKSLEFDKVNGLKSDLEKFKARIDRYSPKDDLETKEKEILLNKVNIGLEIYKIILDGMVKK
jgi:hypothetical protein